ncbi:pyruvate dehydrogenase (acetyl-transferring) E1 component subunit alpha [Candidatus Acetothermia bacterium]|nr:pyruvate dehydrogenase (acetyl-transferring) E1 component subunit alpha [Candidatus Acetothermia bacterium]
MAKTTKPQVNSNNKYGIPYVQVLDVEGNAEPMVVASLGLKSEDIKKMYRWMVTARIFDERALALQRQGRLGTYAPLSGQEACQVGSGYALKPEDWMFPSYREHAAQVIRGQRWLDVLTYWGGNEEGNRVPENVNNFTISIPIATQMCHATGTAWAMKIRGQKAATIVYFGDGATSEGDFHEGLNFAAVFQTGTVFFCQNNQYAISVPRAKQTHSETIAQKAIAYGIPGVQVDGNDIFAVYQATKEALERGRNGGGPTLIEAVTYRMSQHTTADDWTRYRSKEEVEEWKKKDPILRLRLHMQKQNMWSDADEQRLQEEAKAEIAQVVQQYEALPQRDVEDIFKYVYAEMPWNLKEQLAELREYLNEHGGDLPKE